MKVIKKIIIIYIFLFFTQLFLNNNARSAQQRAEEKPNDISLDIPSLLRLKIENAFPTINLADGAAGAAYYDQGYVEGASSFPTFYLYSNTSWSLKVKVSGDWNIVNGYKKPTSDLQLKIDSSYSSQTNFQKFISLSVVDQEIASSYNGVAGEIYEGQYRILLDWIKDIPGSYNITVIYTLSTLAL